MKKSIKFLIFILILIINSTYCFAKTYQLTCISNNKSKFTINFLIDTEQKSIFHLNSFHPEKNKTYKVQEFLKIIEWRNDGFVLAYKNSDRDNMPNVEFFDLSNKITYLAGFYSNHEPWSSSRNCFSSDG